MTAQNHNEACLKALTAYTGDHADIDPDYFWVDERGFRGGDGQPTHETMPEFAIPTDKILKRYKRDEYRKGL